MEWQVRGASIGPDRDEGAVPDSPPSHHLTAWEEEGFPWVRKHFRRWKDKTIFLPLRIWGLPVTEKDFRNKMLKVNHQQVLRWYGWGWLNWQESPISGNSVMMQCPPEPPPHQPTDVLYESTLDHLLHVLGDNGPVWIRRGPQRLQACQRPSLSLQSLFPSREREEGRRKRRHAEGREAEILREQTVPLPMPRCSGCGLTCQQGEMSIWNLTQEYTRIAFYYLKKKKKKETDLNAEGGEKTVFHSTAEVKRENNKLIDRRISSLGHSINHLQVWDHPEQCEIPIWRVEHEKIPCCNFFTPAVIHLFKVIRQRDCLVLNLWK